MWYYILAVFCLLLIGCLIRSAYERTHIVTTDYEVYTEKLGRGWDGYTFCFLTDLHNNTYGRKGLSYLEEKIAEVKPDCILIGGDMMCCRVGNMPDFQEIEEFICRLASSYRVIYALGNHEKRMRDYLKEQFIPYYEHLQTSGVEWLVNDFVELSQDNEAGRICVTGLDLDWCYFVCKISAMRMVPGYMERTLAHADKEQFQILLPHSPIYLEEYAEWGADLTLAGHFHGGTIRLPWLGGLMTPQYQLFYGRDRGRYRCEDSEMIVSGGLGTHSINLRLNNPAELVAVHIRIQNRGN